MRELFELHHLSVEASPAEQVRGRSAFDHVAVQAVRSAGYERAYTTSPRRVTRRTDPFRVPRHVVLDWDGDEFAARISAWLPG